MKLVEQHLIKRTDPRYKLIDEAAFASKNLWNAANYLVRQFFIHHGVYLNNVAVFHQIKIHEAYQALPRKVSNQVLLQLHKAWVGFFEAMKAWKEHPEQFTGRPKLPGYKHKMAGRNLLVYELGAIWKRELDRGVIALSGLEELVQTAQRRESVEQVRIVHKRDHYVVEVIYQYEARTAPVDPALFVAADLGVECWQRSPPTNRGLCLAWSMAALSNP